MEIKFKELQTNQKELIIPKPENPFHTRNYYKRTRSIHDQLMNCQCWHAYWAHQLGEGKCDADFCICPEFKQGDIEIWDFKREKEETIDREYKGGLF